MDEPFSALDVLTAQNLARAAPGSVGRKEHADAAILMSPTTSTKRSALRTGWSSWRPILAEFGRHTGATLAVRRTKGPSTPRSSMPCTA